MRWDVLLKTALSGTGDLQWVVWFATYRPIRIRGPSQIQVFLMAPINLIKRKDLADIFYDKIIFKNLSTGHQILYDYHT